MADKRPVKVIDYDPSNSSHRRVNSVKLGPYHLREGLKDLEVDLNVKYKPFEPTMIVSVMFSVDGKAPVSDSFHLEFGEVHVRALPVRLHLDFEKLTESEQNSDYGACEPCQIISDILAEAIAQVTEITMSGEDEDDTPDVRIHIHGVGFPEQATTLSGKDREEFEKIFVFKK